MKLNIKKMFGKLKISTKIFLVMSIFLILFSFIFLWTVELQNNEVYFYLQEIEAGRQTSLSSVMPSAIVFLFLIIFSFVWLIFLIYLMFRKMFYIMKNDYNSLLKAISKVRKL